MGTARGPLILGASGQIGRALHRLWRDGHLVFDGTPVWQVRPGSDRSQHLDGSDVLVWDILNASAPAVAVSGVIALTGVRGGADVTANAALAQAAVTVADGRRVLLASSQSVYGPQAGVVLREDSACTPQGEYGTAKLAMEQAVAAQANVTCLRMGNVIGADQLFQAMARGPVPLDRFADGSGPRRMMIGPLALGQALTALLRAETLPKTLNLAQPGLVAMADMLVAADAPWHWKPAPQTALPSLELDLHAARSLIPLAPAVPADLIAQARLAGWQQARP